MDGGHFASKPILWAERTDDIRGNRNCEGHSSLAEGTNKPICTLTIDFKEAFDRMSHSFLFMIL